MVLTKERKEELLLQQERDRERTKRYRSKKKNEHGSQKPGRPKVKKKET